MSIVPYAYFDSSVDELLELEDRIIWGSLTHYASGLLEKAFHNRMELERSLQKAFTALKAANLPVSRHFRTVFLCGNELTPDWMISDLGLRLLLINADVSNPVVAKLQVQILSDGYEILEHD